MRFLNLRLQNFRNIEFTELPLGGERHFLLGANGQGKSNLLEALGLATALRSFRTQTLTALPRKGHKEYALVYQLEHDHQGATHLEIHSGRSGRSVQVDGEKVTRLVEFIGRFPTVTLCSGDLMLLRGGPGERRRFMDLTLAVVNRGYYTALRDFHRGIAERNRLLKNGGSAAELSAFEAEIAPHASTIASYREAGMAELRAVLCRVYDQIAEAGEGPELDFRPNVDCRDPEVYRRLLQDSRPRDRMIGATQRGPHRDDFHLALQVGGAREYASDGQQRGLCVALRIAQASFYHQQLGVAPVLLADDVLGELDPVRRQGFWRACPAELQVIATGTELPVDLDEWRITSIANGQATTAATGPLV
ncbi:DNA replication and repair protein RecF [Coraliomargarita sp. SDUM461004]|uniref:DNA replication and repair protein RecF n=1 Tax=Thalassobacterium sedimentorum TaxID=3041258 RepID=A0ABU1AL03_9BACT|nr:DNA replication and repair protein RecF [Coraliomargarita sp. SDUM461004]MDQ8194421.1 DNA replication and repair protein RecF [Coraliomargarita sp. SDUM461004]